MLDFDKPVRAMTRARRIMVRLADETSFIADVQVEVVVVVESVGREIDEIDGCA